ncbi:MAG: mannosyltransferase, partial [Thermoleophilaceae bacterium]|nr:mannosyltransferase [Thermoleophilaceae bacterium]
VMATGCALLPLAIEQSSFGHTAWITNTPLPLRVLRAPGDLLVGFDAPLPLVLGAIAAMLAAVGVRRALARASVARLGDGVVVAAKLGLAALALPALLGLVGVDYFNSRNVIPALVPLVVLGAAGFVAARGRGTALAAAGLCTLSLGVVLTTASEPKYHSEDWRTAARALGSAVVPRAIVVTPGQAGRKPLEVYLPGARPVWQSIARVGEVDVVVLPRQGSARPPSGFLARLEDMRLNGFHLAAWRTGVHFALATYRARAPQPVSASVLAPRVGRLRPAVLVQR